MFSFNYPGMRLTCFLHKIICLCVCVWVFKIVRGWAWVMFNCWCCWVRFVLRLSSYAPFPLPVAAWGHKMTILRLIILSFSHQQWILSSSFYNSTESDDDVALRMVLPDSLSHFCASLFCRLKLIPILWSHNLYFVSCKIKNKIAKSFFQLIIAYINNESKWGFTIWQQGPEAWRRRPHQCILSCNAQRKIHLKFVYENVIIFFKFLTSCIILLPH